MDYKKEIAEKLIELNELIMSIPDDDALKVVVDNDGNDFDFYLDNLTKFTSLKSIFNSKELLW